MKVFRNSGHELEAENLTSEQLEALGNEVRQQILLGVAKQPMYPSEAARKHDLSKQAAHYHFKKLEEAGLVEKTGEEEKSGGKASIYSASAEVYVFDTGAKGEKSFLPQKNREIEKFLEPMLESGEINGTIVAGSADQHGPDQVRARDGHLAAEIASKLGNYGEFHGRAVALDTEISRDDAFDQNLFMLGGVLTNTVAKKFNDSFPAKFTGEEFPYREISTPENTYTGPNAGIIAKTENPENSEKSVYIAAGVRNQGTEAAALAFKDLEKIAPELVEKGYVIVEGLDNDGDGRIDDYEVVE